ncbi:MAG: nucleotidyltransferase [Oscillospiraceae bacterium]|nr:nucleotidyltransferase [Oscillospiraceae bacterium]
MAKLTLVVLAAGMGSRFGERIKQLEPLGPSGELLIDYSIYDAIKAGFDRVVFIIRKDIEQLFKSTIGERTAQHIPVEYVFQSPDILPCRNGDFPDRTKPWGTAHALWCCKDVLDGPFAVINADDFYGRDAFLRLGGFLSNFDADGCSVGFMLKNTLSEYGSVNRGVCKANDMGLLCSVEETREIKRDENGVITGNYNGKTRTLDEYDTVSMSMWGFGADFMPKLEKRFCEFLEELDRNEPKAELTIADAVDAEIRHNGYTMRNLTTDSKWFGITYAADVEQAKLTLINNVNSGTYTDPLWK